MQNADNFWWKKSKGTAHESVFPYVAYLKNKQNQRELLNLQNMRLYGNSDYIGLDPFTYTAPPANGTRNTVTANIVQNAVDTIVSKIGKNKPKPFFLTDGGDWSQQRKAERLNAFAEGQFYATNLYSKGQIAFKDSCVLGTGALKIYRTEEKIQVERAFINEIIVDDVESFYGEPRQMHQEKWVHKEVLKGMFPAHAHSIEALGSTYDTGNHDNANFRNGDMILVIESWHLSSSKKKPDGKRTICINNTTLVEEAYTRDYFPFVFFRWNTRLNGFFGQGIAEQLTGIQYEINKILKTIQVSMHLVSVPKIYMQAGSKIVKSHLDNRIGGIIEYNGQPPVPGQLGIIPAELFSHLDRLYSRAYELIGISQLSATSQKPAGLNSGKAMRTYNDLETERFMSVAQRYEQVYLDASKQMIDLAKEIHAEYGEYAVKASGSNSFRKIDWSEVELDEDQYIMQAHPVSYFSGTPEDKFQQVQEWMQAGLYTREEGLRLLEFPDTKSVNRMINADLENIERQIELIVEKNQYTSPEPYQNLQMGITKMQQAYLMYQMDGCPDETLELFRQWMADADSLLQRAQAATQPPVDPSAGLPPDAGALPAEVSATGGMTDPTIAVPQAQPTSDLLPVA